MPIRYTMTEMVQLADKAKQPVDQFIRTAQVIEAHAAKLDQERRASPDSREATLRRYRDIAKAWPQNAIRIAFSVAMILTTHPRRIAIATSNRNMTCDEARELMRAYRGNVIPIKTAR